MLSGFTRLINAQCRVDYFLSNNDAPELRLMRNYILQKTNYGSTSKYLCQTWMVQSCWARILIWNSGFEAWGHKWSRWEILWRGRWFSRFIVCKRLAGRYINFSILVQKPPILFIIFQQYWNVRVILSCMLLCIWFLLLLKSLLLLLPHQLKRSWEKVNQNSIVHKLIKVAYIYIAP